MLWDGDPSYNPKAPVVDESEMKLKNQRFLQTVPLKGLQYNESHWSQDYSLDY